MSLTIFLARPVTHASAPELDWAVVLREAIERDGTVVRFGGVTLATTSAEIAENNVEAVTTADALVAIVPSSLDIISSVWVEIGMALAASIPVLLVTGIAPLVAPPFVVEALTGSTRYPVVVVSQTTPTLAAEEISRVLLARAASA